MPVRSAECGWFDCAHHREPVERVRRQPEDQGLTLIELLVVIAIISILATAVMPLSRMTMIRVKETELRSGLRVLRTAIDAIAASGVIVPESSIALTVCRKPAR